MIYFDLRWYIVIRRALPRHVRTPQSLNLSAMGMRIFDSLAAPVFVILENRTHSQAAIVDYR